MSRDDAGFTVVETMLASALLALILSTLLGVLDAQTKAERRVRATVDNQEDVRFALLAMARDIRASDPLLPVASASSYGSMLELQMKNSDGSHKSYVRWQFEASTARLTRQLMAAPGGAATSVTYTLLRVRNADVGAAVFRYYNSSGAELTPSTATSADFANCTIRVHLTLYADSTPGPAPFGSESDAELRNRLPGGVGC
jgi:Tfp pilus assembly protein PilW